MSVGKKKCEASLFLLYKKYYVEGPPFPRGRAAVADVLSWNRHATSKCSVHKMADYGFRAKWNA